MAYRAVKAARVDTGEALMTMASREDGRNAAVMLYPNRIERVKGRKMLSPFGAQQASETIPLASVTHVALEKDGIRKYRIRLGTSGGDVIFRVSHAEGAAFRDQVTQLLLERG